MATEVGLIAAVNVERKWKMETEQSYQVGDLHHFKADDPEFNTILECFKFINEEGGVVMKMAKSSPADLDMATELVGVLDDIERGYFPCAFSDRDSDESERLDPLDIEQNTRLHERLCGLLRRGSIGRVIYGMTIVCDPSNECIDPNADTIEHHPKRQQMESALLWTLYHHQGGSSNIGQPIRKLLGIGQYDRLSDEQLSNAKAFGFGSTGK